ncbi:MAG TPA: CHRD domain-containing protein [Flavobacterium sp.]
MKALLRFSAILLLFFIGNSCSDSNDDVVTPAIVTFSANLTAVAGTGSTAYGDATLKFNKTTKTFEITVNYTGLTATDGHIHGADGGIVFPFSGTEPLASPIVLTFSITDAQITELMANHYYVNLHTAAFTSGEISGTLIKVGTTGGGGGGGY